MRRSDGFQNATFAPTRPPGRTKGPPPGGMNRSSNRATNTFGAPAVGASTTTPCARLGGSASIVSPPKNVTLWQSTISTPNPR